MSDLMMALYKRAETCSLSFDTLQRNKVLCFDTPTLYHFDIWYCTLCNFESYKTLEI